MKKTKERKDDKKRFKKLQREDRSIFLYSNSFAIMKLFVRSETLTNCVQHR